MISFLIPFRNENLCPHRSWAFTYVVSKLVAEFPNDEIIVKDSAAARPFNRSEARNRAAQEANGEVLVFLDADSVVPDDQIRAAVSAVAEEPHWTLPYSDYFNLNLKTTDELVRYHFSTASVLQPLPPWEELINDTWYEYHFPSESHPVPAVGGCVVVTPTALDEVGGWDERFQGWGCEDRAFVDALTTILGPASYIKGNLYHLWHPAPEKVRFDQPYFQENQALLEEYRKAQGNKGLMRRLVRAHSKIGGC